MYQIVMVVLLATVFVVGCTKKDAHDVDGSVVDEYSMQKFQKGKSSTVQKSTVTLRGGEAPLPPDKEEEGAEGDTAGPSQKPAEAVPREASFPSSADQPGAGGQTDAQNDYEANDRRGGGDDFYED